MADVGDAAQITDGENAGDQGKPSETSPPSGLSGFSLSIWPPSQRTRDAVVQRLVETLSSPSVLTKRYGSVPADEAASVARIIEQEALAAANSDGVRASDDDGLETIHIYSKEISNRMIQIVKSWASSASSTPPIQEAALVLTESPPTANGAEDEASSAEPVAS
ncbi:MFP1 attachment factor 1-like [Curcuma longa]|uniref:MFP1 attachment factor 1-like n=1 Tax=Curcuma longa TaxID=136217 RepID=UPI003D9DFA35